MKKKSITIDIEAYNFDIPLGPIANYGPLFVEKLYQLQYGKKNPPKKYEMILEDLNPLLPPVVLKEAMQEFCRDD